MAKIRKVMIVDDLEIMRRQIKRLPLWGESSGFAITSEAEDGLDALDKLNNESVDLLITDIKMPRVNGMELLREVKMKNLATCVVFLSEHGEFHFAREAIQSGIFDYLVKPVKETELRGLLERVRFFIEELEQKELLLENLEEKLIEKIDLYYPKEALVLLLEEVSQGGQKAADMALNLVEMTASSLDHDPVKTGIVLDRVYNQIMDAVTENFPWFHKLVVSDYLVRSRMIKRDDIEDMKVIMTESVQLITSTINEFVLRSEKSPLVKEICLFVLERMENKISMVDIAEKLYLTKNHIGDTFKGETGITVGEYINKVKMERAKRLVQEGKLKNYEISQRLGYSSVEYFGKLFKRATGLSPLEYRDNARN